jgi:hypothetical protein
MNDAAPTNPKVAVTAAVLCVLFVVFVFMYDDLRSSPFVQGITSLLVALTIAVVLFSAVRGSRVIRIPLGVVGAAGFYLLLLPQIKPFVFPFYTFTGYVAVDNAENTKTTFTPVEGAEVEIKDTGLRSSTNAAGQFTISKIPSQITVTHLVISRAGQSHIIETKNYPDNVFRIPSDPSVIKSTVYPVSSNEWVQDSPPQCGSGNQKKFTYVAQFQLTKTVQNEEGYSEFVIRVWCDSDEMEIFAARKQQPARGQKVRELEKDSGAQKWQIPIEGRVTTVSLYVCVGTKGKETSLSKSKIQSAYWFQKVG